MIELDHVTKNYGTRDAVRDLNLSIPAGELFAFLGPNGAGKTTTIKMLCGLLFPTAGSVRIGGLDLRTHGRQARQLLAYVPDQPYLYDKLTGREFLQFTAAMYGLPDGEARERIAEVVRQFELESFVDELTERYSHGMRQRTVFASALVHRPRVLIVDEPTVGLDPRSVRLLKDLLRQQASSGCTVFLSSHSLDVVEELADRIGILHRGTLIGCGTVAALRTQAAVDGTLEDVFLTLTEEEKEAAQKLGGGQESVMSTAPEPLGPMAQQGLLQWLRLRLGTNAWRLLFGQSLLRPTSILAACAVLALFVFFVSYAGFNFLQNDFKVPLRGELVGRLIDMLFFTLGMLLIFSGGLILYGGLFHAPEAMFLLSKPLDDDQIFSFKFQGAVAFSSWAFLLLAGPVLVAFGIVAAAPWYFYPLLLLYFFGFVLVPGALGALLMLGLVNLLPRRRKTILTILVVALVVALLAWIYYLVTYRWPTTVGGEAVNALLGQFAFAASDLIPNRWVGFGLRSAARGEVGPALYYLALVWSNGLFLYLVAAWAARFLYRRGFNLLTTGGDLRRRHGGHWLDHGLEALLFFIPPRTRLLIVKDFRTFRRDPQQWGQVLIFFSLMLLYVWFVPRIAASPAVTWQYTVGVGLLNLLVVALLISIFTSRFIYPMLSLEGRKFWVLGLMPLERSELLWGKFVFSSVGVLLLSAPLILISDGMLGTPWLGAALHLLTVVVLSVGLSGLSVGIGALLPNFRETDPSVIAVGFGGTVNLIAGLLFLLATVALMDLPYHVGLLGYEAPDVAEPPYWLIAPLAGLGVVLGVVASWLPLRMGLASLKQMEF